MDRTQPLDLYSVLFTSKEEKYELLEILLVNTTTFCFFYLVCILLKFYSLSLWYYVKFIIS